LKTNKLLFDRVPARAKFVSSEDLSVKTPMAAAIEEAVPPMLDQWRIPCYRQSSGGHCPDIRHGISEGESAGKNPFGMPLKPEPPRAAVLNLLTVRYLTN